MLSVARRVGITPPSIYAHFPDREAILAAVIGDAFDELVGVLTTTHIEEHADPVVRLRAGCEAYLDFAERRPQRYRVLFQTARPPEIEGDAPIEQMLGYPAFSVLLGRIADCVASGRSRSTEPFDDATALWVALHGYATLHATVPGFPWPSRHDFIGRLLLIAKVEQ